MRRRSKQENEQASKQAELLVKMVTIV